MTLAKGVSRGEEIGLMDLSTLEDRLKAYVQTWARQLDERLKVYRSGRFGKPRLRRWLALVAGAAALGSLAFIGLGSVAYLYYASDFTAPSEVRINTPSNGATILDRQGNVLYQYLDDREGLRTPVALDEISTHLIAATIATEDSSFYDNPGVNPKGLMRAVWENLNPLSGQFLDGSGGSSITQQLVKNVYFRSDQRANRSMNRKAREAVYAIELTSNYDKAQILEWYLNQISYGGVYNGIEAASQGYFDKPAKELTLAEAALLAGMPQSPSTYNPLINPEAAITRRNQVLDLMASHERIKTGSNSHYAPGREEIEAAKQTPLVISQQAFRVEAPHFVFTYVQPEIEARLGKDALYRNGLVVTTSIDLALERKAQEVLEQWISQYENASNTRNGAVVVIEPRTGEILAMLGSRDYFRDDIQGQNNNALALNSPGSSFKPFVYLASFLKLGWGPATAVEDTAVAYRNPDGSIFQPVNPARNYQGTISVRTALGNSLNVPAFKTAVTIGIPDIVSLSRRIGFTSLNGQYGPAIAIGGVDLTALDLTYAYGVLANSGVMTGQQPVVRHKSGERELDPVAVLQVADRSGRILFNVDDSRGGRQVVPAEHAFLVSSIISDPQAQCLTFGCGGLSVPGRVVAVKTGTSEPYDPKGPNAGKIGETWAFGYTPEIVVGVWAGNADNAPITNVFSTTIAFQVMRDLLQAYFDGRPSTPFTPPDAVVRARVCFPSGTLQVKSNCQRIIEDYFVASVLAALSQTTGGGQNANSGRPQSERPQPTPAPKKGKGPKN